MEKKKIKIWRIILLIIAIVLLVFIGTTIRKMMIISELESKVKSLLNSNNYYMKTVTNEGEQIIVTDFYSKGDKAILNLKTTTKVGAERILINYFEGEKTNTYMEADGNKTARLNSNGLPSRLRIMPPLLYKNNLWISFVTSVKSAEYNGKSCYVIKSPLQEETYIEKETGLVIRTKMGTVTNEDGISSDVIIEYQYEFENVLDTDLQEPNILEYTIEENNNS